MPIRTKQPLETVPEPRDPYLFGFLYTWPTDEYSDRQMWTYLSPRDNLYRHPDRQMWQQLEDGDDNDNDGSPKKPHRPYHDIYSLGVVLLEIGLGRPADELVKLAPYITGGGIEQVAREMTDARSAARRAKLVFLALAETALPGTMGDDKVGVWGIVIPLGGSVLILAAVGVLSFLWFADASNSTWKETLLQDWLTRAIAISAEVLKQAMTSQGGIMVAMLASLLLERSEATLPHLAFFTMMCATAGSGTIVVLL
ncbi:hypothetical protein B0T18DRAFT_450720 [Schizothecium vesticola]|uniref:Protein kinase domain-containing protein n=1 Tax=Schizothecium vesticola TaxID=314040 RepID=A0AA40BR33_9PEZI|nr:hypothetical protein B0T18DRAFT_450720 [Schizothecium vesticola]